MAELGVTSMRDRAPREAGVKEDVHVGEQVYKTVFGEPAPWPTQDDIAKRKKYFVRQLQDIEQSMLTDDPMQDSDDEMVDALERACWTEQGNLLPLCDIPEDAIRGIGPARVERRGREGADEGKAAKLRKRTMSCGAAETRLQGPTRGAASSADMTAAIVDAPQTRGEREEQGVVNAEQAASMKRQSSPRATDAPSPVEPQAGDYAGAHATAAHGGAACETSAPAAAAPTAGRAAGVAHAMKGRKPRYSFSNEQKLFIVDTAAKIYGDILTLGVPIRYFIKKIIKSGTASEILPSSMSDECEPDIDAVRHVCRMWIASRNGGDAL